MTANGWRSRSPRGAKLLSIVLLFAGAAAGCNQEMRDDSRLKPYEPSPFFADGRSARQTPAGAVPRSGLRADQSLAQAAPFDELLMTGKQGGAHVTSLPMPLDKKVLERGRDRYNIYCTPCHAQDGSGNGMIVMRDFPRPPSYHEERLRRAPVGYIYDVATNGYGVMYGYWDRIEPEDRWAIAAYVKTLQYSQFMAATTPAPAASHGAGEHAATTAPPAH